MRKCIIICDLTALNAESAEQMALLHLTRLFPRRKEADHARLGSALRAGGGVSIEGRGWNQCRGQGYRGPALGVRDGWDQHWAGQASGGRWGQTCQVTLFGCVTHFSTKSQTHTPKELFSHTFPSTCGKIPCLDIPFNSAILRGVIFFPTSCV